MNIPDEKLQAARMAMIRIVQARPDGKKFVPIVLELERQIATNTNIDSELARIMKEAA